MPQIYMDAVWYRSGMNEDLWVFWSSTLPMLHPWIYFLCGVAALFGTRTWQVRIEQRPPCFPGTGQGSRQISTTFWSAIVILCVMGVTYFVSTILSDAVEPLVERTLNPTPQADVLLPTPANTPLPGHRDTHQHTHHTHPEFGCSRGYARGYTYACAAGAAHPDAHPPRRQWGVVPALCPTPGSSIVAPGNGAVVSGMVSLVGTAQHDNFDYYKLEYAPGHDAGQGFVYFDGSSIQVAGGFWVHSTARLIRMASTPCAWLWWIHRAITPCPAG